MPSFWIIDADYLEREQIIHCKSNNNTERGKNMCFDNLPYGYNVVWYDDFSSPELDKKKWRQIPAMSGTGNGDHVVTEGEHNLKIENNELVMSARREPDGTYTSNKSLTTKDKMAFKYGLIEMRAKVPYGKPAWPSFWTQSYAPLRKAPYMTEIDIFEVFAKDNQLDFTIHKWYEKEDNEEQGYHVQKGINPFLFPSKQEAEQYHIYAMNWTPEKIEFLIDGRICGSFDITESGEFDDTAESGKTGGMTGMHDYAYLLFNCYIFTENSSWKPYGIEDTCYATENDKFPIEYKIDWIRIAQKEGEGGIALF